MDRKNMFTTFVTFAQETVSSAPKYSDDVTLLKIDTCIVVKNGTVDGNPSVDLQLTDENGKKYVVMATGGIIESIGSVVAGVRQRSSN